MRGMTAREIYDVARQAGFSPEDAVTWTAIALAESGGRPDAHNGVGEDSWGLWQVNIAGGVRKNRWGDLTVPLNNARAAFEISRGGRDMSPWTTTHDHRRGGPTDYRRYARQAEQAAGVQGDWGGVRGYGDRSRGRDRDGTAPPSQGGAPPEPAEIDAGAPLAEPVVDSDRDGLTDDFEKVAGTDARRADTDRDGLSDGFEASRSRTDPRSGDTDRDGRSDALEWARGTDAGRVPGVAGVAGSGALRTSVREGVPDRDGDGLSDRFEEVLGTSARRADSDGDALSDALEHARGTDPLSLDTDRDGLADGLELSAGGDPLAPGGLPDPGSAAAEVADLVT